MLKNNIPPEGEQRTRAVMMLQHAIWYLQLSVGEGYSISILRYALMSFGIPHMDTNWQDWLGYGER